MTKTLKDLFEVYRPKPEDEQKFVDKHVTIKHKDRNGNGDDVFNASNIKTIDRKKEAHGHNPGEDEKVYEEVEETNESFAAGDKVKHYKTGKTGVVHDQLDWSTGKKSYMVKWKGARAAKEHWPKELVKEAAEELDELSRATVKSYVKKAQADLETSRKLVAQSAKRKGVSVEQEYDSPGAKGQFHRQYKRYRGLDDADYKLNPRFPGKVPAKESVEVDDVEQIDELSKETLTSYVKKSASDLPRRGMSAQSDFETGRGDKAIKSLDKIVKRQRGVGKALDKITKEEVEQIDELSKKTMGNYVKRAHMQDVDDAYFQGHNTNPAKRAYSDFDSKNTRKRERGIAMAVKKLTKEDIINRTIEKYMPEEYEAPTPEERLIERLEGLSEAHIHMLLGLFDSLTEENQATMLETASTPEGIRGLLDFAIQNRGE